METAVLGVAGTIALAVLGWAAKAAVSDPRTFQSVRPFILVTFGMLAFFGLGLLAAQSISPTGRVLVFIGSSGAFGALLLLHVLAAHVQAERESRRQTEKSGEKNLDP